jgi:hydroxysqualene synthase
VTDTGVAKPAGVETPSGKDAAYENFPVGSFLLPAKARPHVAVFYRYARAIDDIADNPDLAPDEKIRRLDGFAAVIRGDTTGDEAYATGMHMRTSLMQSAVSPRHCLDLIDAFKQDAVKNRYNDWPELIDYCLRSAAPVGRYLIDLTGGTRDDYASSDALCNALQVINHLQDCQDDFLTMDRVYLPQDWMREAGADVDMLAKGQASAAIRMVLDRCLEATRTLMLTAKQLPANVQNRRLAMESAAIIRIADALIEKLSNKDPLAARVELSKAGYVCCIVRGASAGLFA